MRVGAGLGERFRRLWAASTVSNLADGIVLVGAPLVVVQLTRDPRLVAGVQTAVTLPWLLLALHVGALADRRDRRTLMMAGVGLPSLVLGALGAATLAGWLSLPTLYLALLFFGVGEVLFDTSAQSALPELVSREELGRANGWLVGAQTTMERFVGAPIAGVVVATSLATVFLGPAALYLLAAAVLVRLPGHFRPPARPPASARSDIAEGLRFLFRHPTLRALAVLGGVLNVARTAYFSVFVLFAVGAQSPMGLPEEAYGPLWTGLAAGSVIGSLAAGQLERTLGPRRLLLGTMASFSLLLATPVLTSEVLPIAAMLVAVGFLAAAANIVSVSSRQRIVPDALLGRVNSAYRLLGSGGQPLGAILGGLLAQTVGLRALFAIVAATQLAVLIAVQAPITDTSRRQPRRHHRPTLNPPIGRPRPTVKGPTRDAADHPRDDAR